MDEIHVLLVEDGAPARRLVSIWLESAGYRVTAVPDAKGDKIYNGAVDNATGCAMLLELARVWAALPQKPQRSALFLFVTAEEAGLIGSDYYGKHPHQEVNLHGDADQYSIYKPFVKRAWRVERPDLLPEIIDKAFHLAESGRPGPVLVNVPMDIFSAEIPTALFDRLKSNARSYAKPSLDEAVAEKIVAMLLAALQSRVARPR